MSPVVLSLAHTKAFLFEGVRKDSSLVGDAGRVLSSAQHGTSFWCFQCQSSLPPLSHWDSVWCRWHPGQLKDWPTFSRPIEKQETSFQVSLLSFSLEQFFKNPFHNCTFLIFMWFHYMKLPMNQDLELLVLACCFQMHLSFPLGFIISRVDILNIFPVHTYF